MFYFATALLPVSNKYFMDFCLRIAPLTILICITLNLKAQKSDSVAVAEKLYNQYDVPGSVNAYLHVANDAARPGGERAKAYLAAANLYRRFYRDDTLAARAILNAEKLNV